MTLTVPLAGTTAGRTANVAQFAERSTIGDAVADLGTVAQRVGKTMTDERLRRERARAQTDVTRDINDLRLAVEQIGDPDEKEATWTQGVTSIRGAYLNGAGERPALSVQNHADFGVAFDQLTNSLGYGIGAQVIETRRSQDRATLMAYGQEASVTASQGIDPAGRETLKQGGYDQIDRMVASGVLTAEQGEAERQRLHAAIDAPAAAAALASSPGQLAADLEAGAFSGLSGSDRTGLLVRARAAVREQDEAQVNAIALEMVAADPATFLDNAEEANSIFGGLPPETLARHRITAGQTLDAQAAVLAQAEAITVAGMGAAEYLARDANGEFADLPVDEQARRRVAAQTELDKQTARMADDNLRGTAITLRGTDPAAFLARAEAGEFAAIPADELAGWANQARASLEAQRVERRREEEKVLKERTAEIGTQLETYVTLAGTDPAQQIALDQAFLDRPDVKAHPDYPKFLAAMDLRAERTAWQRETPAALAEMVQREESRPATYRYDTQRLPLVQAARDRATEGWSARPLDFAREEGFFVPALDLEDPSADPQDFARQLANRAGYAGQMAEAGYTAKPVVFDPEETERLQELTGPEADPDQRLALAQAMNAAKVAPSAFGADRLFTYAQGSLGDGMAPATVGRMLRGEAIIEERNIIMPPVADRLGAATSHVEQFFAGLPGGERLQADAIRAADALYATRSRAKGPTEDIDEDLYRQAMHEALGGTGPFDDDDRAQGGLQSVRDVVTILPRGVSAAQADDALSALDGDVLARISSDGRVPMAGGEPLSPAFRRGAHMVAVGRDRYQLVRPTRGGAVVAGDEDGQPWTFSLRSLIREAGR